MGVYKFWNPATSQYEIIKSKSIINADGTNEYTPDEIKTIEDNVGVLSGVGGVVEKANKSAFDEHLADEATETKLGHVKLSDIPTTPSEVGAEPVFEKRTAFNKDFGNLVNTVAMGNHTHTEYSKSVIGEYIGDNSNDRVLNLGFTPKLVVVWHNSSGDYPGVAIITGSINPSALFIIDNATKMSDSIKLNTVGLEFRKSDYSGYHSYNKRDVNYHYIAFA